MVAVLMILGVVGAEEAKFTKKTRQYVIDYLVRLYPKLPDLSTVVSGDCHLGGVDRWAIDEARKLGFECIEHTPKCLSWTNGYKPRNIRIAEDSDEVICITVKEFPSNYSGSVYRYCYHCLTDSHIKSGGCWTTKYARGLGKPTRTVIVSEHEPYISEIFNGAKS